MKKQHKSHRSLPLKADQKVNQPESCCQVEIQIYPEVGDYVVHDSTVSWGRVISIHKTKQAAAQAVRNHCSSIRTNRHLKIIHSETPNRPRCPKYQTCLAAASAEENDGWSNRL